MHMQLKEYVTIYKPHPLCSSVGRLTNCGGFVQSVSVCAYVLKQAGGGLPWWWPVMEKAAGG